MKQRRNWMNSLCKCLSWTRSSLFQMAGIPCKQNLQSISNSYRVVLTIVVSVEEMFGTPDLETIL